MHHAESLPSSLTHPWRVALSLLLAIAIGAPVIAQFAFGPINSWPTVAAQALALFGALLILHKARAVRLKFVVALVAVPVCVFALVRFL
jgi:membrane protein YdbS with pleckstrin-like domain